MWADKLALQSSKVQKRDADNKWRLKAADAVAMHCLHELKVPLLAYWPFSLTWSDRALAAMSSVADAHVLILCLEQCSIGLLSPWGNRFCIMDYLLVTSTDNLLFQSCSMGVELCCRWPPPLAVTILCLSY